MPISAKVFLDVAGYWLDRVYDYSIPEELNDMVVPGMRVKVPFGKGNRPVEGFVLSRGEYSGQYKLKSILSVSDTYPCLDAEQLKLAVWMRDRFYCTAYESARAMLPNGLLRGIKDKTVTFISLAVSESEAESLADAKKKRAPIQSAVLRLLSQLLVVSASELKHFTGATSQTIQSLEKSGYIVVTSEKCYRRPNAYIHELLPLPELNSEQQKVYEDILALYDAENASTSLLYGVTGSGKTMVYLHLISQMLEKGKSSILLVPEISLTPQMIRIFSQYFGNEVALIHSSLSDGERFDEWKRIRSGEARVVIGTRSAVFSPCCNLGLVIIDEEQEYTYKSESNPRYHTRDVAGFRCLQNGALLVLGSATPDLDTMYRANQGSIHKFSLENRYNRKALPPVQIVDMRKELQAGNSFSLSRSLVQSIQENITRGEQSILFLNRRGTYSMIACIECGFTYSCPNCSVNLTYHGEGRRMLCHHCGYSQNIDEKCPDCGSRLIHYGFGTQKVVDDLHTLLPDVEILRMDADTVAPSGSHEQILSEFREKKVPVLVGTQMVTKGLDFENVTLVGVLNADQSLYRGSFRSNERSFSLITQVIGRAGRGNKPGRAIIQTYTPENPVLRFAARQDYGAFYDSEISMRKLQICPPFADVLSLTVSSDSEHKTAQACQFLLDALKSKLSPANNLVIFGPAPMALLKINNRYRYQLSLHGEITKHVRKLISDLLIFCGNSKEFCDVLIFADLNPFE